jgi:hypothetical protein
MSIRSYVRSTDNHRKPCGEYILTSIDVPIDACCITARTIPATNIQRQFIHHKPAMVTSFTAREKAVNLDQCSPVPFTLILKLTKHLSPGCIGNRPSKLMVANHVSNGKVFDSDYAISPDQISSQLMQEISTGIFDFGMYLGYFKSRFMSVTRAFGFPTRNARSGKHLNSIQVNLTAQFLLRYFEFLIQPIKMFWVSYLVAITGSQKTRNTNVNPNLIFSWGQWLNSWIIHQQRNKPPTRRLKFDCDSRWASAIRQQSRPNYIQRLSAFCQPQITIAVFKSRLGKFSRATIAFCFKPWVLGTFAPEVSKSFLQISKTLLQRYRTNLIEKFQVFRLFPASQQTRSLFVRRVLSKSILTQKPP